MFSSRSLSLVLSAVAFVLIPVTGFALFSSPAKLLDALEHDMRPREYSVEMHGHADTLYFSFWAKGQQQGLTNSDARGMGMMTVDIVDTASDVDIRVKLDTRYIDGMFYIQLAELTGKAEGESVDDMMLMGIQEQWISIPLEVSSYNEYNELFGSSTMALNGQKQFTEAQIERIRGELMNALFSVDHTIRANTEEYNLFLQPNFLVELMRVIVGMEAELRGEDRLAAMANVYVDQELRAFEKELHDALDVSVTVRVEDDVITEWETFGSMEMEDESIGFSIRGNGAFTTKPVVVDIPEFVVPFEDAIAQYFLLFNMHDNAELLP